MALTAVGTIIISAAAYAACQLQQSYCSAHAEEMAKSMWLMAVGSVRVGNCSKNYAECIRTITRKILGKIKYKRRQIFCVFRKDYYCSSNGNLLTSIILLLLSNRRVISSITSIKEQCHKVTAVSSLRWSCFLTVEERLRETSIF